MRPAGGFTIREPRPGEPATEDTEVRVLYTAKTLYVGVHARLTEPDALIAKEMQRDGGLFRDDSVVLLFDTFDDNRNAYFFEFNALGARTDSMVTDEGRDVNFDWDGVWDIATRRHRGRLDRRGGDPLLEPALRSVGGGVGLQRAAPRAAQERDLLLGADPPRGRHLPRLALRRPRGRRRRRAGLGAQRQALRGGLVGVGLLDRLRRRGG